MFQKFLFELKILGGAGVGSSGPLLEAAPVLLVCAEMKGMVAPATGLVVVSAPLRWKGAICLVFSRLLSCKLLL